MFSTKMNNIDVSVFNIVKKLGSIFIYNELDTLCLEVYSAYRVCFGWYLFTTFTLPLNGNNNIHTKVNIARTLLC